MSHVKVVELNIEGRKAPSLAPIVHTIRQQSKKQLNELLQNLFNNTDDALFELADRSRSDQHQEMYFDSMRLIRLHRKTLATNFVRAYHDSFNDAFTLGVELSEEDEEEVDPSDFSLLDQDELEMNVAVSGIVSKVTSQYSLAVMQLTKRLDFLAKQQTISERTNPLGPYALSTAFSEVLGTLEVDIKIRIILMKMFERFVMERLGPIYESANRALIDADVLPDLRNKPPKRSKAISRDTASETSMRGAGESAGMSDRVTSAGSPFSFNTVQSLLAGARGPESTSTGMAAASGVGGASAGGNQIGATGGAGGQVIRLPPLASNELVRALSEIQHNAQVQPIDLDNIPELGDVRSLVLTQSGNDKKSLGQADEDTVNFVGMLFDYILNDRNLAIPMKALISRLQIPIIKLAILDKSFFEKTAHPARALLNELSSAGIGWSGAAELKRDALYNKIESVVLRVLNEFSENPDIFMELLKELRAFVSTDSRRSVLVEQRVKESESGKAKTLDAKIKVQNLVNQKACGLRLPSEIGTFISEIWTRVLTLRMVKQGANSLAWTGGVASLDDLLWALQPLSELDAVDHRDSLVSALTGDLTEGMHEIGCPSDEIDLFCDWLSAHLVALSDNDRAYLEDDERPELDVVEAKVEEIVLAAPTPVLELDALSAGSQAQISQLTEGTWVEIAADSDRMIRCKLATVTQPGNNYVFVNRRGMKVLEKDVLELAELIDEKKFKRIDESQVFDRALQSVIGNLRQMQRERSQ